MKNPLQDCCAQTPSIGGDVVWKWSLVCSFLKKWSVRTVGLLTSRHKLEAVICQIWAVKGLCALLCRSSAGLVCFTCETQASTRPHCCLSQCSHQLISAQGLTAEILTLCWLSSRCSSLVEPFFPLFCEHSPGRPLLLDPLFSPNVSWNLCSASAKILLTQESYSLLLLSGVNVTDIIHLRH